MRDTQICDECDGTGNMNMNGLYEMACTKCRKSGWKNIVKNNKIIPIHLCVKVRCRWCHGVDNIRSRNFGNDCQLCEGVGDVLVFHEKIGCGYCKNRGKIIDTPGYGFYAWKCNVCYGCGWAFARKVNC